MSLISPKPDASDDAQGDAQLAQKLVIQANAAASSNLRETQEPQVHSSSDAILSPFSGQESHSPSKPEGYVVVLKS